MSAKKIANPVGPVLRSGELADAVIEAIREDNPGQEIEVLDRHAYVRISLERECIVRRATLERCLGRPISMQQVEPILGSFSGQIDTTENYMRFYLER
ncbi:MAG: MmoB/DmpM family protein [Gammaproteobacteria bacterium]